MGPINVPEQGIVGITSTYSPLGIGGIYFRVNGPKGLVNTLPFGLSQNSKTMAGVESTTWDLSNDNHLVGLQAWYSDTVIRSL